MFAVSWKNLFTAVNITIYMRYSQRDYYGSLVFF